VPVTQSMVCSCVPEVECLKVSGVVETLSFLKLPVSWLKASLAIAAEAKYFTTVARHLTNTKKLIDLSRKFLSKYLNSSHHVVVAYSPFLSF
jgi:hypothetical protein